MPRGFFEQSLRYMKIEVIELGTMVLTALEQAVNSLKMRNLAEARLVIQDDQKINDKRYRLEEEVLEEIALQQPVAHDLRNILAALFIAGELERMGDHARSIARISLLIGDHPLDHSLVKIPEMAALCQQMLTAALDAFEKEDPRAALAIGLQDDEVDQLFDQVNGAMIQQIIEDPAYVNIATYLISAAHNLERFADRIVNICERIRFLATGELKEIKSERQDVLTPQPISALLELDG